MATKNIFLLRHGHAVKHDGQTTDHERPLDDTGQKEALQVAALLKERHLLPERIISSSALRARQTAELVAAHTGYRGPVETDGTLYTGSMRHYMQKMEGLTASLSDVLLVGHNPVMEDLLYALSGERIKLSPAALALVTLDIREWAQIAGAAKGHLKFVRQPDA